MSTTLFEPFQKIARLKRECLITEKIDGTNAQIHLALDIDVAQFGLQSKVIAQRDGLMMLAGSRTRYLALGDDNFGFAKWVAGHADDLWSLGEGRHYGEWWGLGIQRGYGLSEKRFSLFNAWRWNDANSNRPACCGVVPNLYTGPFSTEVTSTQLERLRTLGSVAVPGFMKPEGIIIYLLAARTYFKQTLEKDEEPKRRGVEHGNEVEQFMQSV